MKCLKRVFTLLLALSMLLSIPVMADVASDVVGTEYEEAVTKLTGLSILTGYEDGTFRPDGTITRAEFSAIISRVIGLNGKVEEAGKSAGFTDVAENHWATKYIDLAFSKGIINGYGNGLFGPEDKVTYEQAVKMIVCTLGFVTEATAQGGYPSGYLAVADAKAITKNTKGEVGAPAPRGLIAQLIYNSLSFVTAGGETGEGNYYYVAPGGNDKNPGTEDKPWATFAKAANTAKAGDTVIFEDGTYNEKSPTVVATRGTKENPIVFKSRNRHGAKIVYDESLAEAYKFQVCNTEYIVIQDFEITQETKAIKGDNHAKDQMIRMVDSNNISVIGNKISNVYEDAIKGAYSSGLLIDGNIVSDCSCEGIDFVDVRDSIIRNTEINNAGRAAMLLKGGTRSVQVYNNYVHSKDVNTLAGISLGGSSAAASAYGSGLNDYEGYNMAIWNNIIIAEGDKNITYGISFTASKDCAAYNNIVVGCKYGFKISEAVDGVKEGWAWNSSVVNPVIKNNIFMDCGNAYYKHGTIENPDFDYNLVYNTPTAGDKEPNSIYNVNPRIVDEMKDWHIYDEKSPLIGAGVAVPEFIGNAGQKFFIGFDRDLNKRGDTWSIGPFEYGDGFEKYVPEDVVFQDPSFMAVLPDNGVVGNAFETILKHVYDNVKKIKVFIWNADTLMPLMTGFVSEAAAQ